MTEFVKIVMEFLLPVLIIIVLITQVLMPMFIPSLEYFWLFRKGGTKHLTADDNSKSSSGLDEAVDEVADTLSKDAQKFKETKDKVDGTIEKLKSAKKDSFNNLNNN